MTRFVLTSFALCGAMAGIVHAQDAQMDATRDYEIRSGIVTTDNDGTFNYQGYLELDGAPANGTFFFRFEAFEDPTGPDILSELYFESLGVAVVDGLFDLDVQMGGTPVDARRFWREVGNKEMYLEIGVSAFNNGNYTTLGTRSKVGWSARAQYAGIAEGLTFPYTDIHVSFNGDPETMISLTNMFGGTILELIEGDNTNDPILDIKGETSFNLNFGTQNGALRVDAVSELIGILSFSNQYPIAGILASGVSSPGAGILGQVNSSVNGAAGVQALNNNGSTRADLATDLYAGDFSGDVLVDGDIKRQYGGGPASATPIAYGYVTAFGSILSGSGNFSVTWDSINSRYLVDIDNENYFVSDYTTIITPASSSPRLATTSSISGDLIVRIFDPLNSYNLVQTNFQFVTYKDDPNITVINRNNTTMDDPEFYELHGLTPEYIRIEDAAPPKREMQGVGIGN